MALKIGDTGPEVGELHQRLIEAGYGIDALEASGPMFGPSTRDAVKDFQARHVDGMHHALAVDGIAGPATRWALDNPGGSAATNVTTVPGWSSRAADEAPEVREVMSAAIAELGVREVPDHSNAGPRVDLYQAPQGPGLAWCAAFVCWCWARREGGLPFPRHLSVYDLHDDFQRAGRLLPPGAAPRPGDVFLILRAGGKGHCGLVASLSPDGQRFYTVEGNASDAVRGLARPLHSITAFARPLGEVPR